MPKFHLPIVDNQMLADVFVFKPGNSDERQPCLVKALFDTGATGSCVTSELVKTLALTPVSKSQVATANGIKDCNNYRLRIGLPFPAPNNKFRVETPSEVIVAEIDDNPIWKMIIGMDIIQQGVLVVDSGNYIFSL